MNDFNVIFGTGPLGKSVMRELVSRGEKVRMINTSGHAEVPVTVEVVKCDAYSEEQTKYYCRGAKTVFQCAQPPYNKWREKFPALQHSIAVGAYSTGAKLVAGDNYYMYGDVSEPLTEDMANLATTKKGKVRAQMAEDLMLLHKRGTLAVCIARGADFFGPEVTNSTMGGRVFPALINGGTCSMIGNVDLLHSYTFIDDFGKAMVELSSQDNCFGQIWHVPSYNRHSSRQVIEVASSITGKAPKISSMGKGMMRIGGLFLPEARETLEMMYVFEKPFVFDVTKYTSHFNYRATPLHQALEETIKWYKDKYNAQK